MSVAFHVSAAFHVDVALHMSHIQSFNRLSSILRWELRFHDSDSDLASSRKQVFSLSIGPLGQS